MEETRDESLLKKQILVDRRLMWSVGIAACAAIILWWQVELYSLDLEQQQMEDRLNYYALLTRKPKDLLERHNILFHSSEYGFALEYDPRFVFRGTDSYGGARASFELFDPAFVPPPQATAASYRMGQDALYIDIYDSYTPGDGMTEDRGPAVIMASSSTPLFRGVSDLAGPYLEVRVPVRGGTAVLWGFREAFLRSVLATFRSEDF